MESIFASVIFLSMLLKLKAMKKILVFAIALLIGSTVTAQNPGDYPSYPNSSYKCIKLTPLWDKLPPVATLQSVQMLPDCFPPSYTAMTKNYHPTPPVYGPNSPTVKYTPEKMKPDYPNYPPVAYQHKNQMLPY